MRRRGSRALVTAAAAAVALLEACFGSTNGKTDSETHFACMVDSDCRMFGKDSRCHEGFCRTRAPTNTEADAGDPLVVSSGGRGSGAGGDAASNAGGSGAPADAPPIDDTGGRSSLDDASAGSA